MSAELAERQPHEGRSLTVVVFERLRKDLISGALRPSERLRVQALSERYRTGATALREALSRLVSEGLVHFEDQCGFLAAPVSRGDLIDLTETRVDIESLALGRAIARGDTAWEAEVLASCHRLSRCPLPLSAEAAEVWSAAHQDFHESLLAGCGSTWLRSLCRLLYDKSERYRHLANLRTPPRSGPREDEHQHLMTATLSRDPVQACELLAAHYRKTTEFILRAPEADALFVSPPPARRRTRSPA